MHRTQIMIEEWQYQRLRARAEREGRSMSHLIREILGKALESSNSRAADKLRRMEGIAEDGADYGEQHDKILYGDPGND